MPEQNIKTPIYFLPGLAANPTIFKNIQLDPIFFEIFYLDTIKVLHPQLVKSGRTPFQK